MKNVIVVRHAKSSWDNITQRDFDRPLNDRGNRDAPMMAQRLLKRGVEISAFISSPANRAFSTATYFAEAFDVKKKNIVVADALYHAEVNVFYDVINGLIDELKTVVLFSHNPGITSFVNSLTQTHIDNMPTCGIFAVKADIKSWRDFGLGTREFCFFDYPKM